MVNLLFISDNTKISAIKNALQPFLKVKIDVVGDFDYGLKDVFEKRPATVFIQDQIAGVTGESVARHIKMLLGAGAPSFIFMHGGGSKAKPIKGLFEYLIDVSQSEVKIVADIQATLKSLLGPQWEKIYIPPKIDNAATSDAVSVPRSDRVSADQLVDDLLSDMDNSGAASTATTDFSEPVTLADEPFHVVSSTQDQLAEMHAESSRASDNIAATTVTVPEAVPTKPSAPANVKDTTPEAEHAALSKRKEMAASVASPPLTIQPQPAPKEIEPAVPVTARSSAASLSTVSSILPENTPLQQTSAADFIISAERTAEYVASENLLRDFEVDYYARSAERKRFVAIAVVLTICAVVGVWFSLEYKQNIITYISRRSAQPPIISPAPPPRPVAIQKPASRPEQKDQVSALPSFIPQAGFDSSFSSQKPGWERYVDATLEYRVYRLAGKIKALQVMGIRDHDISDSKLRSILIELAGDGEYRVKSREQKLGYHVSRAILGQKAELLIYRKKSTVRAFVITLD
jgi:flagellar FliL protein